MPDLEDVESISGPLSEAHQIAIHGFLFAIVTADGAPAEQDTERAYRDLNLGELSPAGRVAARDLLRASTTPSDLDRLLACLAEAPPEVRNGAMLLAIEVAENDDLISQAERALLTRAQKVLGVGDVQLRALESYAATLRALRRSGVDDASAAQARRRARARLAAVGVTLPESSGAAPAGLWAGLLAVHSAAKGLFRTKPTGERAPSGARALRYSEVCNELCDADVLLFQGRGAISRMLQGGGGSPYSHAGIAAWWNSRLMLLHAHSAAICAVPLGVAIHEYDGTVDWYRIRDEYRGGVDAGAIIAEAQANLGLPFARTGLMRNILHEVVGLELPDEDGESPAALFCCQYVARAFRVGGLALQPQRDVTMFPSEIAMSPVLRFVGTIVPDLDLNVARRTPERRSP